MNNKIISYIRMQYVLRGRKKTKHENFCRLVGVGGAVPAKSLNDTFKIDSDKILSGMRRIIPGTDYKKTRINTRKLQQIR